MKKKKWREICLGMVVFSLILTAGFPKPVLAKSTNLQGDFQVVQQTVKPWVQKRSYQLKQTSGRKCEQCTVPNSLKDLDYHHAFYAAPTGISGINDYKTTENIIFCLEPHNGISLDIDTIYDDFVYRENSQAVKKKLYELYEARDRDFTRAGQVVNYALEQGQDEHFMLHLIYLLNKQYKESEDLVDPSQKAMAGKTLSECKSAIKGAVYNQYPAMRKDQETVTEALMMVKRMGVPEKRTFTVEKAGDLDIKIPDFAVTGTRISSADPNFLISKEAGKSLSRTSGQVDSGIYKPGIQLKEGTGPGTYKFKVSRPNWAAPVTWKFYSRVLNGRLLAIDQSSQYLGKYWIAKGNQETEFSVIITEPSQEDEEETGQDPEPDEDPEPDKDPELDEDPEPIDPKPDEDPEPDDDQEPCDPTEPEDKEEPGRVDPEGGCDLEDKQDQTGKEKACCREDQKACWQEKNINDNQTGPVNQSVVIEIPDKRLGGQEAWSRKEDQETEVKREERPSSDGEDGYELLQNIVIEEDDLDELDQDRQGPDDQLVYGAGDLVDSSSQPGFGTNDQYGPGLAGGSYGGNYGQAPQTGQTRIYEIVASLSTLALFAMARENRKRQRKE